MMLWNIIKKQGLIFFRNPQELLLLIALPMVLITILGTALSGFMEAGSSPITVKIALIENESEPEQVDRFLHEIEKELPPNVLVGIEENINQSMPITALKEIFTDESMKDFVELDYVNPSDRDKVLKDNTYTCIIEVPKNFTYELLKYIVLGESEQPSLKINLNEGSHVGAGIVNNILTQFQDQLSLGVFLDKNGIDPSVIAVSNQTVVGKMTTIDEKGSISSQAYYSIGMVVMNVLYIAGSIGSHAFREKRSNVFDRIIISDVSGWVYFIGVLMSGTIFAFMQTIIVFTFSWLVFGIVWPDLIAFFATTLAFSFSVGGLAVLLSAISYRINSVSITSFFSSVVVTLLSVLGGSFFPIGDFLPFVQAIGNITPNGASMSAYISILRGDSLLDIGDHLIFLLLFAFSLVIVAALCFPKRRISK
ncbi:ABC transporter permease [Ornithinibacillus bavariensis]|uniref:ABC transporter permease n=1 Tax=Ornithinibacillus bavariensis TaxID=545502 RepID=UPI003D1F1F65